MVPRTLEARDEGPERFPGFLPHSVEVGLHTMLLVCTGEVRREPRTELLPRLDRPRSEVHEPSPGWPSQGYMKVARHDGAITTNCCDGGNVHLQEFRRVSSTVVLFRQVGRNLGGHATARRCSASAAQPTPATGAPD